MPSNTQYVCSQTAQLNSNIVAFGARGVAKFCDLNQVTNIDLQVSDDVYLTGGTLLVKNSSLGDYADMQIIDRDQLLKNTQIFGASAGITYGMIPSYPILKQFVTSYYINDQSVLQESFSLPYTARVLAGMCLRIVYHSTGGMTKPWVGMNYYLHGLLG